MELKSNETAIIIVAYNNASFIIKQAECLRHFCKDEFDIIVIDNSTNSEASDGVKYHATNLGCLYFKTEASSKDSTESHAFACNFAYWKFKDSYKYFFFTDHDSFPVKDFSIKEILKDKIMAGLGQGSKKTYFWAGCVMFDNAKVEKELIDFSPNSEFGLDTGGNLYRIIDKHEKESFVFFNEAYHQNPNFNKSFYNFYASIHDGLFMHFVNGSNWARSSDNEERVNSLFNILDEKVKQ
jgi:hypothetical protein